MGSERERIMKRFSSRNWTKQNQKLSLFYETVLLTRYCGWAYAKREAYIKVKSNSRIKIVGLSKLIRMGI